VVFSASALEFLTKAATPVIATAVAYIAFLQWKLTKASVREKLFDRRFDVFKETQKFLTGISEKLDFDQESLAKFTDAWQRSRFLFGDDIQQCLKKIRDRALGLQLSTALMDDPNEAENRSVHVRDRTNHGIWLNAQLGENFGKFKPYLSFQNEK